METRIMKILSKNGSVPLKLIHGHFATNHSHINCYLDMTTLKTRQSEAQLAAQALVGHYVATTIVDTILCLDGTQIIGAYLAQELSRAGFISINAHQTIYVITPEFDSNGQMLFRDNLQPMMLNAATDGKAWVEHQVRIGQILKRNERTHEGSAELWEYAKAHWLLPNLEKGRIRGDDS